MDAEQTMTSEDRIDRIVSEYADRLARDEDPRREELLAQEPELREELGRCFRMIEAGIGTDPGASLALRQGTQLGSFRILRELGRGGMAVVYLSEQIGLDREVALKILRSHITLDVRHVQRFEREARAVARLKHPNVVPIHAVGEEQGDHYIAFELIDGPTLEQVLERLRCLGRRPRAADLALACNSPELAQMGSYAAGITHLYEGILAGVAAAHEAGIVHRDLKPSNILLTAEGVPLIADFGLAKGPGDLGVSITGEVLGTPYYMSPEQARAAVDIIDVRTDIYSLGVVLYELLTLSRPVSGKTYHEIVATILSGHPQSPRELAADISKPLEAVVMKAIEKDPRQRYGSVTELEADLFRARAGLTVEASGSGGLPGVVASWWTARMQHLPFEYRSPRTICGVPWLHIVSGVLDPITGAPKPAKGIVACGDIAIGVYAAGKFAVGFLALGGIGVGLVSLGAIAIGYNALGGMAAGYEARGLFALGYQAVGMLGVLGVHTGVAAEAPSRLSDLDAAAPFPFLIAIVSTTVIWLLTAGFARSAAKSPQQRRSILRYEMILLPILLVGLPLLTRSLGIPDWGLSVTYLAISAAIATATIRWVRRVAPELLPFRGNRAS